MASVITDRFGQGSSTAAAVKLPVKGVSTTDITLSGEQTLNSIALVDGDRWCKAMPAGSVDSGIYIVRTGAWDRAPDFDGSGDVVQGTMILVAPGTADEQFWFVKTASPIYPGTTSILIERDTLQELALRADLASTASASDGMGMLGHSDALPYPVASAGRAMHRFNILAHPYSATGDGVADDTAAWAACAAAAIAAKGAVYVPAGKKIRVTSGFTNSTVGGDLAIVGDNVSFSSTAAASAAGSCIILDSADAASFFYRQTAQNELIVKDMQFACAQFVADRKFFRTSASSVKHTVQRVNFVGVNKPFVFETGTYFQMSSYRDIRFTNSGSFHSEATGTELYGTLMIVDNCDVEGTMPANTEKVICNLAGIRHIRSVNLLVEPSTSSSGWVGLRLSNAYDSAWTRYPTGVFNGFYMEVTGSGVDNVVDQVGGRVMFLSSHLNMTTTSTYALSDSGCVEFRDIGFTGNTDPVSGLFDFEDYTCQVKLSNATYRVPGSIITDPRFTLDNCSHSPSGGAGTEPQRATSHNNLLSQLLWRFDGGYPDPGRVAVSASGGTTYTPTTDATYGRALSVTHSGGTIAINVQARARADFAQGSQFFVVLKGVLPTFASGTVEVNAIIDSTVIAGAKVYTTASSGAAFNLVFPLTAPVADPALIGLQISTATASSVALIHQAEIWAGKSLPNVVLPSYPENVITFSAAAPTAGAWARGDICWNNAPAAAGVPGWVCVTAGTPGTWKAMAAVAA